VLAQDAAAPAANVNINYLKHSAPKGTLSLTIDFMGAATEAALVSARQYAMPDLPLATADYFNVRSLRYFRTILQLTCVRHAGCVLCRQQAGSSSMAHAHVKMAGRDTSLWP
jgi:hypothetical protein